MSPDISYAAGGVAILAPSVPLGGVSAEAYCAALAEAVRRALADPSVNALVHAITGDLLADAAGLSQPAGSAALSALIDRIEDAPKPVIAALVGPAASGGLALALACHARVAAADARFGFPEVKLGLMPAGRATQYLPRLVGVENALTLAATGNLVGAAEAREMGLVDTVSAGDVVEAACALAQSAAGSAMRRTRDLAAQQAADTVYAAFASKHARQLRGLDAPKAAIAAVRAAAELPLEQGLRLEQESQRALAGGPQHKALLHARQAERAAAVAAGMEDVPARTITTTAVIGSGTMGSGIAIALLSAGLPVTLFERDPAALERGVAHIGKVLAGNVRAGRMSAEAADAALAALAPTTDMAKLASVDLVIEAAYETMAVKQDIFGALDKVAKPGAILASNTSYLDLDQIAAATTRPQDVIGLHFFSPANVMKLLEIVRGAATSPEVIVTAFALAQRLRKIAVLSGNAWGFIGNRMLAVRRREAESMAAEGASPAQVDGVIERFGLAMGPFRVGDLAGLDLGWSAETSTGATIRERLCEAGRRGQKTGAGFYDYDEARKPSPSDAVLEIIAGFARDNGIVQRPFTDDEVLDRLLWPMVDEGARILAEGIAQRESDIDAVWLNGYGWPVWTGGPMFHARQTGFAEVVRRLEAMGRIPSAALVALADGESEPV